MNSRTLVRDFTNLMKKEWEEEPSRFWSPWIAVSDEVGYDMTILVRSILLVSFESPKNKTVPIRDRPHYHELAKMTDVVPWSELLMLTEEGNAITLNVQLTQEDREELLKIFKEHALFITN
jgi:hypothetical protein